MPSFDQIFQSQPWMSTIFHYICNLSLSGKRKIKQARGRKGSRVTPCVCFAVAEWMGWFKFVSSWLRFPVPCLWRVFPLNFKWSKIRSPHRTSHTFISLGVPAWHTRMESNTVCLTLLRSPLCSGEEITHCLCVISWNTPKAWPCTCQSWVFGSFKANQERKLRL